MELAIALEFARTHTKSVAVTLRRNGKPQLSNVWHNVGEDGVIRVSITADRAKYHNVLRESWAAVHATDAEFGSYVVLEGPASVTVSAVEPNDETVEALVALYRAMGGEHPDWDEYRTTMVRDKRAVLELRPDHAYGMLR